MNIAAVLCLAIAGDFQCDFVTVKFPKHDWLYRDAKSRETVDRLAEPSRHLLRRLPLESCLRSVCNQAGVPLRIDEELAEHDILKDPASINVDGIQGRHTLRFLLHPCGLDFRIEEGEVVVFRDDTPKDVVFTRTYDLRRINALPGVILDYVELVANDVGYGSAARTMTVKGTRDVHERVARQLDLVFKAFGETRLSP